MKQKLTEIKASEGMYLTQSGEVGENRVFVTAIKGININPYDWREATLYEKEQWDKAHEDVVAE